MKSLEVKMFKKMIRVERIYIKNFKRFQLVDIKPAPGPGPIVFIGKNYLGKSNFLNAICWCLYEEIPFQQNITATLNENEELLNFDTEKKEGEWKEVVVELTISEGGKKYLFKRTWIKTQESKFTVMKQELNDWNLVPNPKFYVDMLLPKALRKYFIFAGENLERLYSAGTEKELKQGIWDIANVTILDRSIDHLNKIIIEIQKEAGKNNPDIDDLDKKKALLLESQEKMKKKREEIDSELIELSSIKNKYQEEQKKNENTKLLVEKKILLEEKVKKIEAEEIQEKEKLNNLLTTISPFIYIRKELIAIYNKLLEDEAAGKLPPDIQVDFIKELQQKGICICGRKIHKSDGSFDALESLLQEVAPAAQKSFMLQDKFRISQLLREHKENRNSINEFLNKRAKREQEKDDAQRRIKELSDQLKESSIEEVSNIENALNTLSQKVDEFNQEKGVLNHEISKGEKELSEIDKSISSAVHAREKNTLIGKKLAFTEESRDNVEYIREKITDRVRNVLSKRTEYYFKELFWDKDQFDKIQFTDNYNLQVYGKGMSSPKNHVSVGESKVLGLATLSAIAELSGFKNVPVFFDAPLSNLGSEIKNNVLNILEKITPNKQLFIFSLDDSEMLKFINNKMPKDKVYRLKKDPQNEHSTVIHLYED